MNVDDLFQAAAEAQMRGEVLVSWTFGPGAYRELVRYAAPPAPSEDLLELGKADARFSAIAAEQAETRAAYIERADELYGEPGSALLGVALVFDEELGDGWRLNTRPYAPPFPPVEDVQASVLNDAP